MDEIERLTAITHWDQDIGWWKMVCRAAIKENNVAFELRNGQGTLFENDKKGNEKAPDFKGEVLINGETYHLAMWQRVIKNGKNVGRPMYSIQVDRRDLDDSPAPATGDEDIRF